MPDDVKEPAALLRKFNALGRLVHPLGGHNGGRLLELSELRKHFDELEGIQRAGLNVKVMLFVEDAKNI